MQQIYLILWAFLSAFVMYRAILCSLAMNTSTGRKAVEMRFIASGHPYHSDTP